MVEESLSSFKLKEISVYQMAKNICYIYYKWCKGIWNIKNKGIFVTFFTKENGNLDSEIAKYIKKQKFSPAELWLVQFWGNQFSKIICTFSLKQNTITHAQKELCRLGPSAKCSF